MNYVCALVSIKYDIKALNINTHTHNIHTCVCMCIENVEREYHITIFITC